MKTFAALIDRLIYIGSRNAKLALIAGYFAATPDPDRGYALAALTGELDIPGVKSAAVRALAETRVDPVLLRLSRDFVGDTAETVALIWPELPGASAQGEDVPLAAVVEGLQATGRQKAPALLADLLDRLDSKGRYALLKLATGGLRVGVSARLAKTALGHAFGLDPDDIEEVWHGLAPPYAELFAWAEGRGPRPDPASNAAFRPFMLAHPLGDLELDLADYAAEWKWDGIRVQIASNGEQVRIYSRGGEEITGAFPDVAAGFAATGVVDGELLVRGEHQGGEAASFNALQQRIGRKVASAKLQAEYPAFVRLYDVLFDGEDDVRTLPWHQRRARLEALMPQLDGERFDLSRLIEAEDFAALGAVRNGARDAAIEGLMLKRRDSAYVAGRRTGLWYKWKRDPLTADCVMMYAQRGSGKRSSFYSDFTFGCWSEGGDLLPVGKAYSGFTDAELKDLDRFVRQNTMAKFGPVREVAKTLVLEVAFDSIHASKRHKSGLAMRFPRIHRIRTDKPAGEADTIAALQALVT